MPATRPLGAAAAFLFLTAGLTAGQGLSHSLPRGIRVAPLPRGQGGALWVRAPKELCADSANEFHLHQRVEPGGVRFVAELPVAKSTCEWRFENLEEGEYEAIIMVVATQHAIARAEASVVTAVTGLVTLQAMTVHVQGFVTSAGQPRPDVALTFRPNGPVWFPDAPVSIRSDGWYDVLLGDEARGNDSRKYCAQLRARQGANTLSKCSELSSRWDFDIAPGTIQIVVPPFAARTPSGWAHVTLRPRGAYATPDSLSATGGSATFKASEGFRGDFIGVPYGQFLLLLSAGDSRTDDIRLGSAPVTITERDPVVEVTFPADGR